MFATNARPDLGNAADWVGWNWRPSFKKRNEPGVKIKALSQGGLKQGRRS